MSNSITTRCTQSAAAPYTLSSSPDAIAPRPKVRGGKVFAHKKLSAMLDAQRAHKGSSDDALHAPSVKGLMQQCWVPAIEAVRDWGVMPEGIAIMSCPWQDGFILAHVDFDCALPGVYSSMGGAQEASARLLQGLRVPGSGTVAYQGQWMTPLHPLGVDNLPTWPGLLAEAPACPKAKGYLSDHIFRPGFPLLERDLYEAILEESNELESRMAGLRRHVTQHAGELAAFFRRRECKILNDLRGSLSAIEGDPPPVHELYPEVAEIHRAAVASWLRMYCDDIALNRTAEQERDVAFLAYLAGIVTHAESGSHGALDAGWGVLFAWLVGYEAETAMALGRELEQYICSVSSLTYRVSRILSRLERDALTLGDQRAQIELNTALRKLFESGSRLIH